MSQEPTAAPTSEADIEALVLDFGGVLLTVEDREVYNNAMLTVAQKLGLETGAAAKSRVYDDKREWGQAKIGRMTGDEMFTSICNSHGVTDTSTISAIGQAVRVVGRGIHPAMQQLLLDVQPLRKEKGMKVIVLSNYETDLDMVLGMLPILEGKFDFVLNSASLGVAKPTPAVYDITAERLGMVGREKHILFVDDKGRNTQVAADKGWATIVFKDKMADVQRIRQRIGLPPVEDAAVLSGSSQLCSSRSSENLNASWASN